MKRYFFKAVGIITLFAVSNFSFAQEGKSSDKMGDKEELIIRKKGDKDAKFTVEIKDGEVKINGKPLSEFKDDNLVIIHREDDFIFSDNGERFRAVAPRSPFRRGPEGFGPGDPNRAFLGVMTDEDENGAKITSITKESAAEKAGLKQGDVITKVNETTIKEPQQLTEVIGELKPEQKVTITYKRDKKEQKVTATLGKRAPASTLFGSPELATSAFNLDMENFGRDGMYNYSYGKGRFGIKAQDTEDGKGVKVLNVEGESNAAKAGIKEGDIIREFDGNEVNSATELADAAKEAREKNNVKVKLSRDGKTQELEIKIPKKLKTTNL